MANYDRNIDALNAIVSALGGNEVYTQNLDALNAWSGLLGGRSDHDQNLDAYNEISEIFGGRGDHDQNIDAINEISRLAGGSGTHRSLITALNDLVDRGGQVRSQQLLPAATRLHQMISQSAAIIAGREAMISRIFSSSPAYATNTWYAFFEHGGTLNSGISSPEWNVTTQASVYASVEVAGVFHQITFDGQAEGVMLPGMVGRLGKVAETFQPNANTNFFWRTWHVANIGDIRPTGYARSSAKSEAAQWAATPNLSLLSSGSISNTASGAYYGPSWAVCKGNDGRLTWLNVGNSIDFGEDENMALVDARANFGFWGRGLDENVIGQRTPYLNFAIPGARPSNQNSKAIGKWYRKDAQLRVLPNLPFDVVAGFGPENDSGSAFAAWKAHWQSQIDFMHQEYGKPIVIRSVFPRSSVSGNFPWTNTANQTAEADDRAQLNADALAGGLSNVTKIIDVAARVKDLSSPTKWRPRTYAGVLQAQANAGASSLNLDVAPALGEYLILGNGASGFERTTNTNTGNPAATSINPNVVTQRASGSAVVAAPTDDGRHPGTAVYTECAADVAAGKTL
jgi:hypothetical protein